MKRMSILTLFVLMLGMVGFTQAQNVMPVFCGDLADVDCEILTQNQQAMLEVDSYAFALTADFTMTNIPDMPEAVSFGITGDGAVVGDMASLVHPPEELATIFSDSQAYADYLASIFDTIDMNLSLVLTMPDALVEETNGEMPQILPLNVALVDGIGYLDFTTLRDAVGEAGASFPEGWYGLDLAELVTQMMARSGGMGAMPSLSPSVFADFMTPDFAGQFMRIERLEDTTSADGTAVASFHIVIDYAAMMTNPTMQELMVQSMAAQGATMSEEETAQMQAMMAQMFQGVTLDVFTSVGLEDFYTRSTQITMNFDMQSIMAVAAEMGDNTDMPGPAPVLMFNAVVTNTSFNEVAEITAPENATVVPLESLGLGAMPSGATTDPMMAEPTATPAS